MVDFHGSTGYGQAFTDSIRGDWGGKPLKDLQKGLAAALKRYPWMDHDRVGALGASFGGTPWDNPVGYEKHNPVNFVENWKTPMLVIHGALDFRVADTQGLGTFNALQRLGIPSKLLYFPDENHWVLKPHNSILWHETVINWLDHWLKNSN